MNKLTVFKSSVKYSLTSIIILFIIANPERTQGQVLIQDFKNPPIEYRPIPFWHMNGTITTEGINQQVSDAINSGFGGVAVLPVTANKQFPTGLPTPGTQKGQAIL